MVAVAAQPRPAVANDRRLPIGMFARLTHLTRKALKTYERCGLLEPAHIDPETRYRFYSLSQVQDAETIRILRSVGVPLRDIAAALREDQPTSLAALLTRRRAQLMAGLAATDRLLRQLDVATSGAFHGDIVVTDVPAHSVMVCAAQCTYETHEASVDGLLEELGALLRASGFKALGRETATYFADLDLTREYRVEVSVPVDVPRQCADELASSCRRVPPTTVAGCVHQGPYYEIHTSFARLVSWVAERGLPLAGRFSETYLLDERDTDDPDAYRTAISLALGMPTVMQPLGDHA